MGTLSSSAGCKPYLLELLNCCKKSMRMLCPMYLFWQQIGRGRAGTEKKVGECKCHVQLMKSSLTSTM